MATTQKNDPAKDQSVADEGKLAQASNQTVGDADDVLAEGKRPYSTNELGCCPPGQVVTVIQGDCGSIPVSVPTPVPISASNPIPVSGPLVNGLPTPIPVSVPDSVSVSLQRSTAFPSDDQALWVAIRDRTNAIGFGPYNDFIDRVLSKPPPTASLRTAVPMAFNELDEIDPAERHRRNGFELPPLSGKTDNQLHFGVEAYQLLKAATQAFLVLRCGLVIDPDTYTKNLNEEKSRLGRTVDFDDIDEILKNYLGGSPGSLPYLRRILGAIDPAKDLGSSPFSDTLLTGKPFDPCLLELIWSYWNESGMMVQAINAVSLRFQNKRTASGDREPMAELELSPLRPLSNLIWGYIQDEPFRLTVARRTYEYLHHYGLALHGRAVPSLTPAESRSQFLEAFHSLLYQVAQFYDRDADTTVIADGFPLLNGLKEVHMLLAEGAHNQFGDLPWTARVEMLIQQWLLSRREMKEFLRGRQMVPYKEAWMGSVDTVKRLYGWTETPVSHFHDLADYGEKVLLSIRYGDWIGVNDQDRAKNWARYWKPEIQSYTFAYRVATGVDLTATAQRVQPVNSTPPAVLLQQRLVQQRAR